MRTFPQTRIHGVNSRVGRDWSWTCELLVMEMAHRVSTGIFLRGVAFRPRQDLLQWAEDPVVASWDGIHFDKNGDRQYSIWR
jgi:hypothetical protein